MAAPSGLIVAWPSTAASIPAGWTRVTALDTKYPKASTTAGTTGGNSSHTHGESGAHTHSDGHLHAASNTGGGSTTQNVNQGSQYSMNADTHTHTITWAVNSGTTTGASSGGTSSSGTTSLPTATMIFIQSDGTSDIPSGAAMWWNTATAPANWAWMDGTATTPDVRDMYWQGATAGGNGGGTSAGAGHTHTLSHTHSAVAHGSEHNPASTDTGTKLTFPNNGSQAGTMTIVYDNHTHALGTISAGSTTPASAYSADASASGNPPIGPDPPFMALMPIKKTAAGPDSAAGLIGMTVGATPAGFALCNGANGTPNLNGNGYFVKGARATVQVGTTGGSNGHSHTISHAGHTVAAHTHTPSGTSGANTTQFLSTDVGSPGTPVTVTTNGHTHGATAVTGAAAGTVASGSLSLASNASDDPPFSTVIYVQSVTFAVAGADMGITNRITSRFAGPQALRFLFRQRYLPDITLTPAVDYNFGPILARMPSRRVGPGGLRPVLQHTVFTDTKTAFPNLGVAFDAALALRNTLAVTFDAVLATGNATSITFDVAPQVQSTISATFDATLGLLKVTTVTFDAIAATQSTVTATFDALLAGLRAATIAFDAIIGVALGPEAGTADPNAGLPPGAAQVADWITPGSGALDSLASGAGGVDPLPGGGGLYTQPQTGSGWQIRP